MNAGSSERGRHFATKYADLVFTVIRTGGLDDCRAHVQAYHKLAREEYGREVRVWTIANIVQGETEKEARDFYRLLRAREGRLGSRQERDRHVLGRDQRQGDPAGTPQGMSRRLFIAGWGGFPLIGTKEQIVDGLAALVAAPASTACCCPGRATSKACASSAT